MADANQSDDNQQKQDAAAESEKDAQTVPPPRVWTDDEVKKIIEERDKAKGKLRKIDEDARKAEEDKAIEQGKLKEVLEQREKELEQLRKFKESKDAEETAEREGLLAKLNDEDKAIGQELSTPKLRAFVDKQTKQPPPFDGKGAPKKGGENPLVAVKGESFQDWQRRVSQVRRGK